MITAITNGTWKDLPSHINHTVLRQFHCTACSLSKSNHPPQRVGDGFHGSHPGYELSLDYQGKVNPPSARGYTGFWFIKDKFSGYRHTILTWDISAHPLRCALDQSYLSILPTVITFAATDQMWDLPRTIPLSLNILAPFILLLIRLRTNIRNKILSSGTSRSS